MPRERATVVLVIDASLSMQATDVNPTRLDAAKEAAIEFVDGAAGQVQRLRGGDGRHRPPCWCRRRSAHNTVENAINSIQLQDSTAIGEGIATALSALRQAPKDPERPERRRPGGDRAAERRQEHHRPGAAAGRRPRPGAAKVPIYTIAYGTENGYVDLDGKREPVPVDHEEMKEIAELSGGEYFAAATADELAAVYENIGSDGRLREGRPRGHGPIRRLRPGPRRAGRPRRHLLGSEMAVMSMIPMLQFLAPSRLWLLAHHPGAGRALPAGWSSASGTGPGPSAKTMFDLVIPRDRTWLRHVAVGLSILSLLTLTLAFAKPKDQVSVPRERATIVVTIDISLSMEAQDVEPNRLEAAKDAAVQFVNSLPPKFNVALVTFAGTATTVVPPTLDHGAVTRGDRGPAAAGVDRDR